MKNLKLAALIVIVVVISVLNMKVSLCTQKSIKELVLSMYSWSGKFPDDPFEGEGPGYELKNVIAYYHYLVLREAFELEGEKFYEVVKIPTTEIECNGTGDIPCTAGVYHGEYDDVEIMSQKELEGLDI